MQIYLSSFLLGSYLTGMFFMFFFGHLITASIYLEARLFGGMFWPFCAIVFLIIRTYRAMAQFFDFEGGK